MNKNRFIIKHKVIIFVFIITIISHVISNKKLCITALTTFFSVKLQAHSSFFTFLISINDKKILYNKCDTHI